MLQKKVEVSNLNLIFTVIGNYFAFPITVKMDAQLAEMNFALQAPLARREFARKLF